MKESFFLKQNKEKWQSFEEIATSKTHVAPDELADLYIQVTDDLAYAQTYYPRSRTTEYLNSIARLLHFKIYKNKRRNFGRFLVRFWTRDLPYSISQAHRPLLYSLLVFGISVLVGVVSTLEDETFPRLILGDGYVDMTIRNIQNAKPMDVYDGMEPLSMFLYITYNNIMVSFKAWLWGALPWCFLLAGGTAYILFSNGVMLGAFQAFFYKYGLVGYTSSVIWLHGTLEISAIIIAGGAGFVLGAGLLYPKTLTRWESFRRGARHSSRIILGLVPVFMVAGFIESYITRHADMPMPLKLLIILSSFAFVIFYFVWLPLQEKARRAQEPLNTNTPRPVVKL